MRISSCCQSWHDQSRLPQPETAQLSGFVKSSTSLMTCWSLMRLGVVWVDCRINPSYFLLFSGLGCWLALHRTEWPHRERSCILTTSSSWMMSISLLCFRLVLGCWLSVESPPVSSTASFTNIPLPIIVHFSLVILCVRMIQSNYWTVVGCLIDATVQGCGLRSVGSGHCQTFC